MKRLKTRRVFVYSVEIKNTGPKKIAGVVWEYVLTGTGNEREFGRFQFRSKKKVAMNESATLVGRSPEPPRFPKVASVAEITQEGGGNPVRRHVEIRCVLYADGTKWRQPTTPESDCESLDKSRKQKGS